MAAAKSQGLGKYETCTELDSHADTCVVGKHVLLFQDFNRPVNVSGYDANLGTVENCKTVSAAMAYDDIRTGETVMLIVHQAISLPYLDNNLLNPMQLRMNDVRVSEQAKFLTENPKDEDHALIVPGMDGGDPLLIPLSLNGVVSYLPTYKPTTEQLETCRRYELTSETPKWDPHDHSFVEQEDAMVDVDDMLRKQGTEL